MQHSSISIFAFFHCYKFLQFLKLFAALCYIAIIVATITKEKICVCACASSILIRIALECSIFSCHLSLNVVLPTQNKIHCQVNLAVRLMCYIDQFVFFILLNVRWILYTTKVKESKVLRELGQRFLRYSWFKVTNKQRKKERFKNLMYYIK